jgi:hypothetical protein
VPKALAALDKLAASAPALGKAKEQTEEQLGSTVAAFTQAFLAVADAALVAADKAPDSESQQNVINGTKAVAIAAKQLVLTAKDVQRNKEDTMAQKTLASALASFPAATGTLASLLKGETPSLPQGAGAPSGNSVERARAGVLDIASVKAAATASATSVVESARAVSASATPLVFATSPEELNEGAGEALTAVQELVANVKGAGKGAPQQAPALQQATKAITEQMAALISAASVLDRDAKQSEAVAVASASLNDGLEALVGVVNKERPLFY